MLLEQVDDDWFRGAFGMREGVFPASFVEVTVPLPAAGLVPDPEPASAAAVPAPASATSSQPLPSAMVLHDWEGEHEDDLSLTQGQTVRSWVPIAGLSVTSQTNTVL